MKSPALLLLAALPLVSGCAAHQLRAVANDGTVTPSTHEQVARVPICPWRACVLAQPGTLSNIIAQGVGAAFSGATVTPSMDNGRSCDVGFRYESLAWADKSDVISAYTGETLFHLDADYEDGARLACSMLLPKTELGAKLAQQRAAASLPPVGGAFASAAPGAGSAAPAPAPVASVPAPPAYDSDIESPSFHLPEREQDFAVVVGIESYSDLPKATYAERDAKAFAAHVRALGVPPRNLIILTGSKAGRASIQKYVEQWLPRLVRDDSRVYFYFSGHGAPDVKTGQAFLVPWDGDPNFLDTTGYPVKRLYAKLGALPAKQIIVAMDACFSGAGGRSVLASGVRPLVTKVETGSVTGRVTALTASASNEISGALDDRGHGTFTYFLLKGLDGAAKDFSAAGLLRYATPRVQDEARRQNRDQTPQLLGDGAVRLR